MPVRGTLRRPGDTAVKMGSSYRDPPGLEGRLRTLWLLRHAKTADAAPGQDDHARALEPRGRDDALHVGRHLAARGVAIDAVLCSSARRARETLERVSAECGVDWLVFDERELYLAPAADLLRRLQSLPDEVHSVLLVGHNPGIAELALQLARGGPEEDRQALRRKFPTGALAELRLDAGHWRSLPRGCELASFVTPKRLRD